MATSRGSVSVCQLLALTLLVISQVSAADEFPIIGAGSKGCPVDEKQFFDKNGRPGAIVFPSDVPILAYYPPSAGIKSKSDCHDIAEGNPMAAYWTFDDSSKACGIYDSSACIGDHAFTEPSAYPAVKSGGIATAIKGDPHFTGRDNSHFDFTGVPGQTYCLFTDAHLHINAFFGGRMEGKGAGAKALTWIREVGILWGHHTLTLKAREGADAKYGKGYMSSIEVDGKRVTLSQAGDSRSDDLEGLVVKWVEGRTRDGDDLIDMYEIAIANTMVMQLTLRPEIAALRTPLDGVVHFNLNFMGMRLSSKAHGVLGQTYRGDHKDRLSKLEVEYSQLLGTNVIRGADGGGLLDGDEGMYRSSDLLAGNCAVRRFTRAEAMDGETAEALEMSSGTVTSTIDSRVFANRKLK